MATSRVQSKDVPLHVPLSSVHGITSSLLVGLGIYCPVLLFESLLLCLLGAEDRSIVFGSKLKQLALGRRIV